MKLHFSNEGSVLHNWVEFLVPAIFHLPPSPNKRKQRKESTMPNGYLKKKNLYPKDLKESVHLVSV